MKLYDIGLEKIVEGEKATKKLLAIPFKPKGFFSLKYNSEHKVLRWIQDAEKTEELRQIEVSKNYRKALLDFFVEKALDLTNEQANFLMRIKEYVLLKNKFPDMKKIKEKQPELLGMIAQASINGELGEVPINIQIEFSKTKDDENN